VEIPMNKKLIISNVGLLVFFSAIGLGMFTENVRTVQIIGLFACGVGFGAALSVIIHAFRSKQTKA
jgi:hypothetical protein